MVVVVAGGGVLLLYRQGLFALLVGFLCQIVSNFFHDIGGIVLQRLLFLVVDFENVSFDHLQPHYLARVQRGLLS